MKFLKSHFASITIILLALFHVGCSEHKQTHLVNLEQTRSWDSTILELNISMKELQNEKKDAQSYVESAEVHQVTRSKEEKARQLFNLNLYMAEIEFKIDSTRSLINSYEDSIRSQSGQ